MLYLCVCLCVRPCVTPQSCDGSEYTLQGPAGGDDITGLSAEPAHYQLLSELGENATVRLRVELAPTCLHKSVQSSCKCSEISLTVDSLDCREGLQQPEPGEHGTLHPYGPAGRRQTNQPG